MHYFLCLSLSGYTAIQHASFRRTTFVMTRLRAVKYLPDLQSVHLHKVFMNWNVECVRLHVYVKVGGERLVVVLVCSFEWNFWCWRCWAEWRTVSFLSSAFCTANISNSWLCPSQAPSIMAFPATTPTGMVGYAVVSSIRHLGHKQNYIHDFDHLLSSTAFFYLLLVCT